MTCRAVHINNNRKFNNKLPNTANTSSKILLKIAYKCCKCALWPPPEGRVAPQTSRPIHVIVIPVKTKENTKNQEFWIVFLV